MMSHELAKILLEMQDMPIATYANNQTYMSENDKNSHGDLKIAILETYGGKNVLLGNILKKNINKPNWYVSKMIIGNAPDEW